MFSLSDITFGCNLDTLRTCLRTTFRMLDAIRKEKLFYQTQIRHIFIAGARTRDVECRMPSWGVLKTRKVSSVGNVMKIESTNLLGLDARGDTRLSVNFRSPIADAHTPAVVVAQQS